MPRKNQNEGEGVLFPNGRRTKDVHPSHVGQFCLNGVQYTIAGWRGSKTNPDGSQSHWMSLRIKEAVSEQKADQAAKDEDRPTHTPAF